ncbi:Glucokinase OS=Streptomyces tendae OX=1932 GN=F3L20_24205 PE=4 SV=1 [Streptomyces tendae]
MRSSATPSSAPTPPRSGPRCCSRSATAPRRASRASTVSVAARQGGRVAVDSYRELARWVGAGLADLASLFDPSAFIVGGGLSDEGELVLGPIRKSYKRWLVGGNWRPVADVIAAKLGNKAGLVGAADLAREPDPIM